MTHASLTPQERARLGIGEGLLRLSVGIEDPDDLIEDLDQALRATTRRTPARRPEEAVPA
jgi:cystathionine beta-lyase/cystathionine gamma-synthase